MKLEAAETGRMFAEEGIKSAAAKYADAPMRQAHKNKDPRGWSEFAHMLSEHSALGHSNTMFGVQLKRPTLWEMEADLKCFTPPLLVIVGDEDEPCLEGSFFLKRAAPTAALLVIPRTGHNVTSEEPPAFTAARPELFFSAASARRVALTGLLSAGCTTASENLFVFADDMADAVDIEAEEASKLGMRMTLTRGAINLGFADGGLADERLIQAYDAVILDCERVLSKYHDPSEGSFLRVALAPCAPFNVTKRLMVDTADLAEKHDCLLHTHLGETRDEDGYRLHHYGCQPLDYLEQVGWLNQRVWLAHGIHFK